MLPFSRMICACCQLHCIPRSCRYLTALKPEAVWHLVEVSWVHYLIAISQPVLLHVNIKQTNSKWIQMQKGEQLHTITKIFMQVQECLFFCLVFFCFPYFCLKTKLRHLFNESGKRKRKSLLMLLDKVRIRSAIFKLLRYWASVRHIVLTF